jgi:ribosomal protein L35
MESKSNETETANQIKDLLAQLTAAQQSYDVWRQTQPEDLEKQRVQWLSIKDRTYLEGEALFAWKSREPGLSEKPEVVAAKEKIARLQSELASEQSKLNALVAAGTPFAQYKAAVDQAENHIRGILQRLGKQRIDQVLLSTYGTLNVAKLARPLTDAARLHPSVVAIETFAFHPKLSALRESQITQQVVDSAASNAGAALQRATRSDTAEQRLNHLEVIPNTANAMMLRTNSGVRHVLTPRARKRSRHSHGSTRVNSQLTTTQVMASAHMPLPHKPRVLPAHPRPRVCCNPICPAATPFRNPIS